VASHHDHLFQVAFGDPEHAVPLLRTALPASLADAIDWRTLTRKNPTQHGRRSRRTLCDLLFAVRTHHQQDLLLYVVLEHKSQSRRFDALQILDQVVAVLRTHRREHPRDRFLPALLPVVLHADTRPWRSPRNVRGLFDLARIPKPLQRYLPSLTYVLDDLHDVPPERLRRRALSVFGLCAPRRSPRWPRAVRHAGRLRLRDLRPADTGRRATADPTLHGPQDEEQVRLHRPAAPQRRQGGR
jgi:hypothetical protein